MEKYANEAGGKTVRLVAGDRLSAVPASHAKLITPAVRAVFADPPAYMLRVADGAPVPAMAEWFRRLATEGSWRLDLHRAGFGDYSQAGFGWDAPTFRGAEIGPSDSDAWHPGPLGELFAAIGYLDWMGFGVTGLLFPPADLLGMCAGRIESGPRIDLSQTVAWGGFNGDYLIAVPPDFGGWITMNGDVVPLGSVADAIEWVFRKLLDNRGPTLD